MRHVSGLAHVDGHLRVLVLSGDGCLYIYKFDLLDGGEGTLIKQHHFGDTEESNNHETKPEWSVLEYLFHL